MLLRPFCQRHVARIVRKLLALCGEQIKHPLLVDRSEVALGVRFVLALIAKAVLKI